MTEVRWTEQAADDLAAILEFIRRDSPAYAHVVAGRLYGAVGQLSNFPDSGRVVPERTQPTLRELIRPPYRVVYRRSAELVEILTIYHSARLLPESIRDG